MDLDLDDFGVDFIDSGADFGFGMHWLSFCWLWRHGCRMDCDAYALDFDGLVVV